MPIDEKTLVYVDDAIDEEFLKKFFVYLYSLTMAHRLCDLIVKFDHSVYNLYGQLYRRRTHGSGKHYQPSCLR